VAGKKKRATAEGPGARSAEERLLLLLQSLSMQLSRLESGRLQHESTLVRIEARQQEIELRQIEILERLDGVLDPEES
jgi:nitrate reductase NapAB chaperone NapD